MTPGNAIPLSGTSVAARPELAGGVLADVLRPFTITAADGGTISGTLQDRVSIGIDGALLFETRIRDTRSVPAVTGAPAPVLLTVVHTSFSPSLVSFTDVDFATDSLGTLGPDVAARGPGILSFQIGFQFSNGLAGGTDSHFFFARTDSPWFEAEGEYTLSDANGNSTTVVGFQPAIPEPASIALLGLPGLALLRRRRR
ncbi:MAG: PEP-CTERM sorting domain-containing protein [Planctomycetota bacterium]|nr:PEP-CTERM sorting domain-containing protein [Planctomycetota bacterium]